MQVVKWRQETVRCEEARGALEAEVVDTRTQLLEQQQCRARECRAGLRCATHLLHVWCSVALM
jgi:hypothetical protein